MQHIYTLIKINIGFTSLTTRDENIGSFISAYTGNEATFTITGHNESRNNHSVSFVPILTHIGGVPNDGTLNIIKVDHAKS